MDVAWRLIDLLKAEGKHVNYLKLQEPYSVSITQSLDGVDENEALSKQIDIREQEVVSLKRNLVAMTNEVEELKTKKETLRTALDKRSITDSLKKFAEKIRMNQKKEIQDFEENRAKNIQEFRIEIEREINKCNHNFTKREAEMGERNRRLEQDITTLKTENAELENDLRDCEDKSYQSYIGLVCLNLQANMYRYVLPDEFTVKRPYKVKDIEEDIEDEDLLDDKEREEACGRWEVLKGKLSWKPSLERTLKMLQEDGNQCMAGLEGLTVEEAERVAGELNKRGKLKGRTSYEKVKQVIKMWKESITLVQSFQ